MVTPQQQAHRRTVQAARKRRVRAWESIDWVAFRLQQVKFRRRLAIHFNRPGQPIPIPGAYGNGLREKYWARGPEQYSQNLPRRLKSIRGAA